jgi:hypothetical protein
MSIRIKLQNASGKDNLCFYNAVFGAGREFFKICTTFTDVKPKINPIILKKENLNGENIINNPEKYSICKVYFDNIKDLINMQIYQPIDTCKNINDLEKLNFTYLTREDKIIIEKIKSSNDGNKFEQIKYVFKNSLGLEGLLSLNSREALQFIFDNNILSFNYTTSPNRSKFKDFLKEFFKFQIINNQYSTKLEIDLFKIYLKDNCQNLTFGIISSSSYVDVSKNNYETKSSIAKGILELLKKFVKENKNENISLVILYTSDVHYRFYVIDNKTIFTLKEIHNIIATLTIIINSKNIENIEYTYLEKKIRKYEKTIKIDEISLLRTNAYSPDTDNDPEDNTDYLLYFPTKIENTKDLQSKATMLKVFNQNFKKSKIIYTDKEYEHLKNIQIINKDNKYDFEDENMRLAILFIDEIQKEKIVKNLRETVDILEIAYSSSYAKATSKFQVASSSKSPAHHSPRAKSPAQHSSQFPVKSSAQHSPRAKSSSQRSSSPDIPMLYDQLEKDHEKNTKKIFNYVKRINRADISDEDKQSYINIINKIFRTFKIDIKIIKADNKYVFKTPEMETGVLLIDALTIHEIVKMLKKKCKC